ncbi:hypothetical protein LXL04_006397 [Taraxacum kok-saghyz]
MKNNGIMIRDVRALRARDSHITPTNKIKKYYNQTFESWQDVDQETKDEIWDYVITHFDVDEHAKRQTLKSVGNKWKNFKHRLFKH